MHLINHGVHNFTSRWWHYGLVVSLICLTAAVIYSNTFQVPFVFDDQHTIQENTKIRDLRNFYTPDVLRSPRPLVDFTFALNYHFGKLRVFGYHLVNLLIHISNGILVFFLSRMLFRKLSGADNTDSFLSSLFAALIFIAHPLQTQSVTYIAQRYTVMAAFFYLGSVLSYIIARDAKSAGKTVACWGFFLLSIVCGLMAFLSKQNSASLPLAILLVEYAVYDQTWQGWKNKIAFILPGVLLCGIFYAYNMGLFRHDIQLGTFLEDVSEVARETRQISRWHYFCTQINVIAIYIRLLVIPVQQNLDYLYPFKNGFFDGATPYLFVFLLGIFAAAGWNRNKRPILFVAILWFFITLSVESSIFPIRDALFEHRLYLPMFGFSMAVGSLIGRLISKHSLWVNGAMLVILITLSVSTYHRNKVWRDDVALWSDVVQKNPSNYRGLTNLGYALQERGDLKAALPYYDRALKLKPNYYIALSNKGVLIGQMGKIEESISLFHDALRYKPDHAITLNNIGVACARKGNSDEAIAYFQKALASRPQYSEAHFNLAITLANTGKLEPAMEQYLEVLRLDPDNFKAHNKIGILFQLLSRYEAAVYHFGEALKLGPKSADIYLNMGNALLSINALNDAIAAYTETIRLNPKSIEAYTNLGVAYLRNGNREEAVSNLHEALKINPESVEAHANLGNALYAQGKIVEALREFGVALRLKPDSKEILDNINMIMSSQSIRGGVAENKSGLFQTGTPPKP